ncbi:MAG: DAK2 domain-containing protein [Clostridia bacterium]|nr:DAK2 domain-containing protein [Clostridia bacterium]
MQKSLNGAMLRKMVMGAYNNLEINRKYIDSINVYPVPDGDTGSNMFLTFKSSANEVNNCQSNNLDALCEAFSKGALRGARGNSGVILSQIIRGLSSEIMLHKEITTKTFAKAMQGGATMAYKAVATPREGTILTVIRVMAESAESIAKKCTDFDEFFKQVLECGEEILSQTPEMNTVLKSAGVVDSGGRGVLTVFYGFYKGLNDDFEYEIVEDAPKKIEETQTAHVNYENLADIQFAYCTQFMVVHINKKTTESDIDRFREKLMALGDSVICVGDLSLIKVHVHTNEPNKALGYALEMGEITEITIENMLEENRALKQKQAQQEQSKKAFGMVSVAAGDGIAAVFKDLGVDYVIEGGQTMNPSANDIALAVDKVPSDHVFVFPNNKNIILAAEQARNLTKKFIHVVPTLSIPEGVSAMLAFNIDGTLDENLEAMNAARANVVSGSVTHAVRETHVDGFDLKNGDIIGLSGGKIVAIDRLVGEATTKLIAKMVDESKVNITLFYGQDVQQEDAEQLQKDLAEKFPQCEVTVLEGGQPVYYYIISVE